MIQFTRVAFLMLGSVLGLYSQVRGQSQSGVDDLPKGVRIRFGEKRALMPGQSIASVISPDGKEIAYCIDDVHISIRDMISGNEIRKITIGEPMRNNQIFYTLDGKRFLTVGKKEIHLWSSESGQKIRSIVSHENGSDGDYIQLSGDGTTVSIWKERAKQNFVKVWRLSDGNMLGTIKTIHDSGMRYTLSHDGKHFATWGTANSSKPKSEDGTAVDSIVHIWDVRTSKLIHSLDAGEDSVGNVRFSPDGKYVATSEADTVQLWDASSGKLKRRFYCQHSGNGFRIIEFSLNGKTLAVASKAGIVQTWYTSTGKRISQSKGPISDFASLHCRPDGTLIAYGSASGSLAIWEVISGKILTPTIGHYHPAYKLHFTSDGKHLISHIQGQMIRWDIRSGLQIESHQVEEFDPYTIIYDFSPNGKYYITKNFGKGSASLWDASAKKEIIVLESPLVGDRQDGWYAFSNDSRRLIVVHRSIKKQKRESIIKLIDLESNTPIKSTKIIDGEFYAAACSFDGTILTTCFRFSGSANDNFHEIYSRDVATGEVLSVIRIDDRFVSRIAFVDERSLLVLPALSSEFKIYDVYTGREKSLLELKIGQQVSVSTLAVKNQMLAILITESADGIHKINDNKIHSVMIFEVASGSIRHTMQMPGPIYSLALSHDCKSLAVSLPDTSILLYDLEKISPVGERKKLAEDALWKTLEERDAAVAWKAMQALIANPEESVPFIRAHVTPAGNKKPDAARITKWIDELNSPRYSVREATMKQLEEFATEANGQINSELAKNTISLDLRERLERLAKTFSKPQFETNVLRPLRAIEILERINNPAAKDHLKTLAAGGNSTVTRAAREALTRLDGK